MKIGSATVLASDEQSEAIGQLAPKLIDYSTLIGFDDVRQTHVEVESRFFVIHHGV
jgi:hypothetical protein